MTDQELLARIQVEAGKRSGQPNIRGLRITVADVIAMIDQGMSDEEILQEFPRLEIEDLEASRLWDGRGRSHT